MAGRASNDGAPSRADDERARAMQNSTPNRSSSMDTGRSSRALLRTAPLFRTFGALALACVLALAAAPGARAQTGKLSGRVTDAATGEPLIGATAQVEGTALGAVADLDGDYTILQLPPGTYRVRFSYVGYATKTVANVLVASNQTATLNVTMAEEIVEGEEVLVTAERPVVDVQLTSSLQTLSREDIAVLPVQSLSDIVNLQAGVVDGHFRGGRLGEVQYQVDGVSVNNPYNNTSTVTLDRSVLQEVQVISGTFDAEYGQALSGVVNAVLRSGERDRYDYSAEVYLGDHLSPGADSATVQDFFVGQRTVALYPGIERVSPLARQNFQASLSGPLPLLRSTTFLVNGQRAVDQGYLFGVRRFAPTDSANFETGTFTPTGDGRVVPLGSSSGWSYLGKLTNRSFKGITLGYSVLGGFTERVPVGAYQTFRFNPGGAKTSRERSLVHGLDVTHTLSGTLFYEIGLRQNFFDYRDYKYADVRDPRYFEAGVPRGDGNYENGAAVQGVDLGRFVQRTNQFVGKVAVTWQATKVHLFKVGLDMAASDLQFGAPGLVRPVTVDGQQVLGVVEDTLGAVVIGYKPVQASAYVQDRIEWGDLRIRAGVRLELFDANAQTPGDLANPANSIDGAPTAAPKATSVKLALAPRLGVSFPILDRASLYFSYGHFYQLPGLRDLYSNADYSVLRDLQAAAVSYGTLSNPDLKPEFTAQYEFGFKSEITRGLGLDVSAFYKDIRDLLGVQFVDTYTAASYARFTNVDFGGVRGLTVSLDQRGLGALRTAVDYTLQIATGNASDPQETANRAAANPQADPRKATLPRQAPFNWDQRHTLNTSVIFQPRGYSLTGIVRFATGQPYTPNVSSGFGGDLETNSGRKPASVVVDLRAERSFRVAGVDLTGFARVFNLLDARFNNGFVYSNTGSAFYSLDPAQQRNPDPARLFPPRRVEIGLSLRGGARVRP